MIQNPDVRKSGYRCILMRENVGETEPGVVSRWRTEQLSEISKKIDKVLRKVFKLILSEVFPPARKTFVRNKKERKVVGILPVAVIF